MVTGLKHIHLVPVLHR